MLKPLAFTCTGAENFNSLEELERTSHIANYSIVEYRLKSITILPVNQIKLIDSCTIMGNGLKGSAGIIIPALFQISVALQHDIYNSW